MKLTTLRARCNICYVNSAKFEDGTCLSCAFPPDVPEETTCPHCGVIRTEQTDFLQTITNERDRMATATQALSLFMMTDTYKALERVPQDMLAIQQRFMHGYLSALEARVHYYEDLI